MRALSFLLLVLWACRAAAGEAVLDGALTQGGLAFGSVAPGTAVRLDGRAVRVTPEGRFVIGFGRDAAREAVLETTDPDGQTRQKTLTIAPRTYEVQRIDGLPSKLVTPPDEVVSRIRAEAALIAEVRAADRPEPLFESGFIWPVTGIVSGVYGSRRILNGQPRQPHYGVDIAAPTGTPVLAPADGVVALAHPGMYFSGKTLVLDHGHGLTSSFLHLDEIHVAEGIMVRRGEPLATVGATGRVTGAHLDWRINWFDRRIDPALVAGPMP